MVIEDRHISYLREVEANRIRLWWAPKKTFSKYVSRDWSEGRKAVDQTVAAQMKALGLTHVVNNGGIFNIQLTAKGADILRDEEEAWT